MRHRITKRGRVLSIKTNKWLQGLGCFLLSLFPVTLVFIFCAARTVHAPDAPGSFDAEILLVAPPAIVGLLFIFTVIRSSRARIDGELMLFEWSRRWGFIRRRVRLGFDRVVSFDGLSPCSRGSRGQGEAWSVFPVILGQRLVLSMLFQTKRQEEAQLFVDLCNALIGAPLGEPLTTDAVKRSKEEQKEYLERRQTAVSAYCDQLQGKLPDEWVNRLELCARLSREAVEVDAHIRRPDLELELAEELAGLSAPDRLRRVAEGLAKRADARSVLRLVVPVGYAGFEDAAVSALNTLDPAEAIRFIAERTAQALAFCEESGLSEPLEAVLFVAGRCGVSGVAGIAGPLLAHALPAVRRVALAALLLAATDGECAEAQEIVKVARDHPDPITRRMAMLASGWLDRSKSEEASRPRGAALP